MHGSAIEGVNNYYIEITPEYYIQYIVNDYSLIQTLYYRV